MASIVFSDDTPSGLEISLGFRTLVTGPEFRGITNIPCNSLRLFRYSRNDSFEGFFFRPREGSVMLLNWDSRAECLELEKSADAIESCAKSVANGELAKSLGPFQKDAEFDAMIDGVSDLGSALLEELTWIVPGDLSSQDHRGDALVVVVAGSPRRAPAFSLPPTLKEFTKLMPPPLRTQHLRDRSACVEHVLAGRGRIDLLCDLRLAFVLVACLSSFNALECYKIYLDHYCACGDLNENEISLIESMLKVHVPMLAEAACENDEENFFDEVLCNLAENHDSRVAAKLLEDLRTGC